MSDKHPAHPAHEEAHTGPIKTPKQLLLAAFFSFVVPIFAIIGLVFYVTSANQTAPGGDHSERAVAERIQKVGRVEIRDANRPLREGAEVYQTQCFACHASGVAGAPKFEDIAAWGPRLKSGLEALVHASLAGKGAMAPQGGGEFNDTEIARAVVFMTNAAGGTFDVPQAPAAPVAEGASPAP